MEISTYQFKKLCVFVLLKITHDIHGKLLQILFFNENEHDFYFMQCRRGTSFKIESFLVECGYRPSSHKQSQHGEFDSSFAVKPEFSIQRNIMWYLILCFIVTGLHEFLNDKGQNWNKTFILGRTSNNQTKSDYSLWSTTNRNVNVLRKVIYREKMYLCMYIKHVYVYILKLIYLRYIISL